MVLLFLLFVIVQALLSACKITLQTVVYYVVVTVDVGVGDERAVLVRIERIVSDEDWHLRIDVQAVLP